MEGLGWRIGNGTLVNALRDKWVLFGKLIDCPRTINSSRAELSVWELIDFERGTWNISSLSQYFDKDTVDAILTIPLLPSCSYDKIFW